MSEQPRHAGPPSPVGILGLTFVVGFLLDLFALLWLPVRVQGHQVPFAPLLVLVVNAALASVACAAARTKAPASLLIGVAIVVSTLCAGRGPGGDLFVTRDLQGMYLVFVIAACVGAAVPLFRRRPR